MSDVQFRALKTSGVLLDRGMGAMIQQLRTHAIAKSANISTR
jgi:hypothetical protein